ncbi:class I SAM-dependent methyltransferase [Vibrio mediterranei]|uniref:Class I SAM-dependent methyltransferase n=1 Tax=Vibrio mediterranei TaxID=689 RepID=A0ABX5DCG5_9VIBR|nr:class I SAM-dependent methyltransferase [Vibrio mediterranei]PCD87700.1 hypothetical protein COR52_14975 [Vibrio mediterranei]PRQ67324.1 hypothetical protein COR51_12160 [Vibrio mediterranei]
MITHKSENRFSMKILGHKIKNNFPRGIYVLFLKIKYYLFRKKCSGNISSVTYSDGEWVSRKTTKDLRAIQDMLCNDKEALSILQIGIGNSSCFEVVNKANKKVHFTGTTIVQEEMEHAKNKFSKDFDDKYKVIVCNKYSDEMKDLKGNYDYIIDNDISSYACCKEHFERMLDYYKQLLAPEGKICVGIIGLEYFDSGFGLTENMFSKILKKKKMKITNNGICYLIERL